MIEAVATRLFGNTFPAEVTQMSAPPPFFENNAASTLLKWKLVYYTIIVIKDRQKDGGKKKTNELLETTLEHIMCFLFKFLAIVKNFQLTYRPSHQARGKRTLALSGRSVRAPFPPVWHVSGYGAPGAATPLPYLCFVGNARAGLPLI